MALTTFGMVGTSAIYYLLVAEFGIKDTYQETLHIQRTEPAETAAPQDEIRTIEVRTDRESTKKGEKIFKESCSFCHNPDNTNVSVGPGLKGLLRNPTLPASKRPSTPENIADQLRTPIKDMPSFENLQDEDIVHLIAFLNTL
jgi:mono/diheme cytochrome c family protein